MFVNILILYIYIYIYIHRETRRLLQKRSKETSSSFRRKATHKESRQEKLGKWTSRTFFKSFFKILFQLSDDCLVHKTLSISVVRCSGLSIPPVWDIPLMHIHISIHQKYTQIFELWHFLYFISFVRTSKSDYIVMMLMWTVMSKMLDRICSVHMLRSTSAIKYRTIFTMEEIFRTSRRTSSTLFETKLLNSAFKVPDPIQEYKFIRIPFSF